jgi:hypothetical protein
MAKLSLAHAVLLDPLNAAFGLAQRVLQAPPLKAYVRERMMLILPVVGLMLVVSVACAAAMVLFLGGTRSFLVLLSMLLVPFVLAGSLFVQAFVFFSWIESRALAQALHQNPDKVVPPVPWALAFVFLVLPLAMLLAVAPLFGILLVLLLGLAPFAFVRLDR